MFNNQLAATVDVFVTISKMGGGKIPTDRPIDGVDMAPILFNNEKVLGPCSDFLV